MHPGTPLGSLCKAVPTGSPGASAEPQSPFLLRVQTGLLQVLSKLIKFPNKHEARLSSASKPSLCLSN